MGNKNSTMNKSLAVCGKLNGGLGNQLFIIAATYAYALENNLRFYVSKDWPGISKSRPSYWDTLLTNVTQLLEWKKVVGARVYKEIKFSYDKIPVFKHNIILEGYFQSDKYFKNYETEVRELFKLPESLKEFAANKISSLIKVANPTLVAVHIRRGDYIKNPKVHYLQPISYYLEAQEFMEKKLGYRPVYVYFSDDKDFVTKNFNLNENDVIVSCDKDYEEFAVMQQCHHFIIANSSFSWWAAWMSDKSIDKSVICPKTWFGPKGPSNWSTIYPNNWYILRNLNNDNFIELSQNFWRDDIIYNEDMTFKRFSVEKETGILFINNNKLVCLWDYWEAENSNNQLKIISGNLNKTPELQKQNITSRIILSPKINPYDLYLINLENRTDRKESFLKDLPSNIFNVNLLKAVKHIKGAHGCGLSHLYLVQYAKENNLPYIIVSEDDALFRVNNEKIIDVLNLLTSNLDRWTVFNGSPTFGDIRNMENDFSLSKSFNDLFINSSWGQSTSFMIYNSSVYDRILNFNFDVAIDQYFSLNFIQTIYKNEPFVIQKSSYSDIEKKFQDKNYEKIFIEQYNFLKKFKTFSNDIYENGDISKLFFMGILSCKKYKNRRDNQDMKDNIFEYRYFIGNSEILEPVENIEEKIVYLPCKDNYESLTKKVYHMNKWILNNRPDVKYIIKTDDDIRFNFKELNNVCKNFLLRNYDYGGLVVKMGKDNFSDYHIGKDDIENKNKIKLQKATYCAGGCYFYSLKTAKIIDENLMKNFNIFEDYSFGYCLQKFSNISPVNLQVKNKVAFW